jgi:hypothetical protein
LAGTGLKARVEASEKHTEIFEKERDVFTSEWSKTHGLVQWHPLINSVPSGNQQKASRGAVLQKDEPYAGDKV